MANQASAGLSALEMRSRLADQADRQSALARAASALNAHLDRRAVLDTLCREATVALGADISGVYLGDAESGRRGGGGQRDPRGLRVVGIPDSPGRGRGRAGAEHGRARGHERLPGRDDRPRDRAAQADQDRRVRADGLERGAPGSPLARLLLDAARWSARTSRRSRRSPASPRWRAGTPRPSRRPPRRPEPTRSPGCSTTGPSRCARARRSGAPSAPSGRSPACSATSTTSSPSTTATGT